VATVTGIEEHDRARIRHDVRESTRDAIAYSAFSHDRAR
jgi:hypothetical protein